MVELHLEGERRPLPGGVELAAYRVLQHALVAVRGEEGEPATVELATCPERWSWRSSGPPGDGTSARAAVLAARERVTSYGGSFSAENSAPACACCVRASRRRWLMAERLTARRVVASRWFDPALAALLIGVSLVELYTTPGMTSSLRAPIAVVVVGGAVAFRRSHPQIAAGAQAAVFLATPNFDDNFLPHVGAIATSIVAYSCGAHAAHRSGLARW